MITSFPKVRPRTAILGFYPGTNPAIFGAGWCAVNAVATGNTGTYWVTTYSLDDDPNIESNDIRLITSISTDSIQNNPATTGWYAMQLSEDQYLTSSTSSQAPSGSYYHYVHWDADTGVISNYFQQQFELTQVSLLFAGEVDTPADTCDVTMVTGFTQNTTVSPLLWPTNPTTYPDNLGRPEIFGRSLHTDPFGCGNPPTGLYIHPLTKARYLIEPGGAILYDPWDPVPAVWKYIKNGATASLAVCETFGQSVYQYCPLGSTTDYVSIDWNLPIFTTSAATSYAPTGYYALWGSGSGAAAHYWNGTLGVWGLSINVNCNTSGTG